MNSKNTILAIIVIAIVAVLLYLIPHKIQAPTRPEVTDFESCTKAGYPISESSPAVCTTPDGQKYTEQNAPVEDVTVLVPQANSIITSPLQISGSAINSWYFEASFPAKVVDDDGNILAEGPMQAQSDWTVPGQVPFSGTLTWTTPPTTATGELILSKDNPSGLPENEASKEILIRFQ